MTTSQLQILCDWPCGIVLSCTWYLALLRAESIEVMADRRSSDQPAPWRSRNTHNRASRATHTIPTATIVLAGGGESIVLNHATTNQISEIYRAVKATRHVKETDSSKDSTTTTQIAPQTVKNAKRRERRQAMAASRVKAAAAGELGAEPTSTEEEGDGRYTVAPLHQAQHGHTTEDEPAQTASDTDVYEEAEAQVAQKQLAQDKDTQAEEEEEQDEGEEEEAKAVQTEVAEDRLASEEPETEIETGEDALKVLRDLQADN